MSIRRVWQVSFDSMSEFSIRFQVKEFRPQFSSGSAKNYWQSADKEDSGRFERLSPSLDVNGKSALINVFAEW